VSDTVVLSPLDGYNISPKVRVRKGFRQKKIIALNATVVRRLKLKPGWPVLITFNTKSSVLRFSFPSRATRDTHRLTVEGSSKGIIIHTGILPFVMNGLYTPKFVRRGIELRLPPRAAKTWLRTQEKS